MHHPKSRDGSSTFQTGTPKDHPPEEGEGDQGDLRHTPQDHPLEEGAVEEAEAEEAEAEAEVEAEGAVEEHSLYPGTHPPHQLKNF